MTPSAVHQPTLSGQTGPSQLFSRAPPAGWHEVETTSNWNHYTGRLEWDASLICRASQFRRCLVVVRPSVKFDITVRNNSPSEFQPATTQLLCDTGDIFVRHHGE
ncbi:hypothetical protein BaRGS_00022721 [Batillaria attramentaria]|uniref:Uncharacterized protein n=1 Tax=Batillaria attramentaria TaxID=370345 RepID=A0ABD0KGV0_9CAEN